MLADRHTDTLIAILYTPYHGSEVTIVAGAK